MGIGIFTTTDTLIRKLALTLMLYAIEACMKIEDKLKREIQVKELMCCY